MAADRPYGRSIVAAGPGSAGIVTPGDDGAVRGGVVVNHRPENDTPASDGPARRAAPTVEIVAPGPLATIQDAGRVGFAHLGVGRSGAADSEALAAANRLVGNTPGAAGIETTMGGVTVLAHESITVAVTGPPPSLLIDHTAAPSPCRIRLPAGRTLTVSPPASGLRNYLAFRGGVVAVETDGRRFGGELGSMATDTLSGIGPPPLQAGDLLETGSPTAPPPAAEL